MNNQMYNNQTLASPLVDAVQRIISDYTANLVRTGQISQFTGANISSTLRQNINQMISTLTSQYVEQVPIAAIEQIVAQYTHHIIQSSSQAQTALVNPGIQLGGGGYNPGSPNLFGNTRPAMQSPSMNIIQPQQEERRPVEVVPPKPPKSSRMCHQYDIRAEQDLAQYMTNCEDNPIIAVRSKMSITDETDERFNYCSVDCGIPEPSVRQVYTNFISTNPRLCVGKYIADLNYDQFIVKRVRSRVTSAIDLSPFTDQSSSELPVSVIVSKVLRSISEREADIVRCISEIVLKKFNDLLRRWVRLSENINQGLRIQELNDITDLITMRDRKYGELCFHRDYESTILKCFQEAMKSLISGFTKTGHFDIGDIAHHLPAHPNFIIREEGICERELDLTNPTTLDMIKRRYTVFANYDNIVVANFIPNGLPEALAEGMVIIEGPTNPFESLIVSTWRYQPKTIRMKEGSNILVMKNGITLDSIPFVYGSSLDENFGLNPD